MGKQARTPYAILGLLTLYPMTGYELKQFYETSLRFFWSESYGQIYPALKRLQAEGLVTGAAQPGERGRERIRYAITEAGHKVLQDWLVQPVQEHPTRNELLLKMFFGPEIPVEATREHLRHYLAAARERAAVYEGITRVITSSNPHPYSRALHLLTLDYGHRATEMVIAWCEHALEALKPFGEEQPEWGGHHDES